jgi:hypothetical protein
MSDPSKADQERSAHLDTLVSAVGTADAETLLELRQFLLGAMFPSMPESVREVVLPLFALVTLEARSIEQGLPRLVEQRE